MEADARRDPERRRAGPAPGALALFLAVVGLSACSAWITPVPKPSDHGYFSSSSEAPDTTGDNPKTPAKAGASAQKSPGCKARGRAARDPTCFADDLGVEMDVQELRRRKLLTDAREVVNLQATYNTLIYPFGAVAVYEKLRGAPNHNLLLPAVVGTAIYAALGARIPENDKVYLRTAAELQCSLMWHGQWLYWQKDVSDDSKPAGAAPAESETPAEVRRELKSIKPTSACDARQPVTPLTLKPVNLDSDTETLRTALAEFHRERACLRLKGQPGGALAPGALERVKSPGGAKGANTSTQVTQRLEQQSALATASLKDLLDLRAAIADASLQLSADGDVIMADMAEKLAAKVPPLTSPQTAAKILSDPNKSLATAQAGEDPTLMDPVMPQEALAGLDAGSLERVETLSIGAGTNLQKAWTRAQYWLDRQKRRKTQVLAAAQRIPCAETTLALMNEPPRVPAPSQGASSPSSSGASSKPLPTATK